jgi:hypothetical protein
MHQSRTLVLRRIPTGRHEQDRVAERRTGFVGHEIPGEPEPHVSRSNCAPAYYQGRPASLWVNAMKPRHRRRAPAC